MSFKTIFVPMAFEQTAKSVSDAALKMAHAFHGHVMAHHVRQRFASYPPMEFFPAAASATTMAMESDAVHFSACGNTIAGIKKKTGEEPVLLEEAKVVPSGVARLMELQDEGYTYIRP